MDDFFSDFMAKNLYSLAILVIEWKKLMKGLNYPFYSKTALRIMTIPRTVP